MEKKVVGNCPLCGEEVIEKEKLFVCSAGSSKKNEATGEWENEGCQYKIFKTALKKMGKDEITSAEVEELLLKGEVELELISQKTSEPYKAKGTPDEKWGIKIQFNN